MLILTRRSGQWVHFHTSDGLIRVQVRRKKGNTETAIDAPKSVKVLRGEIDEKGGSDDRERSE